MGAARNWLIGLIGGIVSAAANCFTVIVVDPLTFNVNTIGGWKHLGALVIVSALVGAGLFLKQNPTPWNGEERRAPRTLSPS